MKRNAFFCWFTAVVAFAVAAWSEPPLDPVFAITAIAAKDTNLVVSARVPVGVGRVALEARVSLAEPWQEMAAMTVADGAETVVFTVPKPESMHFFRVKAELRALNSAPMVSSELRYVAIASLAPTNAADSEAVFHFKGVVDGCDRIVITREGALWQHVNWDWPQGPVVVNGVQWDPQQKNYLSTTGAIKLLPEPFSLERATLEKIEGRDVIALEHGDNALTIWLNDMTPGFGVYEFKVHFPAVAKPAVRVVSNSTRAKLKIAAAIDGSDLLKISAQEATWQHLSFGAPDKVLFNDISWSLQQTNVLANEGETRYLPAGVDLSTARIVSRKGRDLVTLDSQKDAVWVTFADNPNGADWYELEIEFGER